MLRLTFAAVVLVCSASFASANVAPSRGEFNLKNLGRQVADLERAPQPKRDLMITSETEIKVDGRNRSLEQVPAGAEIILIDVSPDRTVIRRIHFQTRK
jgi:hypothetical protein